MLNTIKECFSHAVAGAIGLCVAQPLSLVAFDIAKSNTQFLTDAFGFWAGPLASIGVWSASMAICTAGIYHLTQNGISQKMGVNKRSP